MRIPWRNKSQRNPSGWDDTPPLRRSTEGWLTCNIIAFSRVGRLATILKQVDGYFDLVRVINGNPDDERLRRLLSRFDVEVFENPWEQDTARFFKPLVDASTPGEWFFWLCDDELPDVSLLEHLHEIVEDCEREGYTSIMVPFMVVQDYIPQNPLWEYIGQARAEDVPGFEPKFRCERLVKMYEGLEMEGPTHMGWVEPNELVRSITEYPILHIKEDDGFLLGNLWPSVIRPEGHGIRGEESQELNAACEKSGIYGNERVIIDKFRRGDIDDSLREWMWKHKDRIREAHFSWFALYFFKYHPEELPEDFDCLTDIAFREWVRMLGGHEGGSRFIERTKLHPMLKRRLLELGFWSIDQLLNLEQNADVPLEKAAAQWRKDTNVWRRHDGKLYRELVREG